MYKDKQKYSNNNCEASVQCQSVPPWAKPQSKASQKPHYNPNPQAGGTLGQSFPSSQTLRPFFQRENAGGLGLEEFLTLCLGKPGNVYCTPFETFSNSMISSGNPPWKRNTRSYSVMWKNESLLRL